MFFDVFVLRQVWFANNKYYSVTTFCNTNRVEYKSSYVNLQILQAMYFFFQVISIWNEFWTFISRVFV